MKPADAEAFIRTAAESCSYDPEAKRAFHRQAARILRELAAKLGYGPGDYDLRHNQGGVAVSGEITLHSETLYVQFSQCSLGTDWGFVWRTCKHRRDYAGGPNQRGRWAEVRDLDALAVKMEWAAAASTAVARVS